MFLISEAGPSVAWSIYLMDSLVLSAERELSPFSCSDVAHFLEFRNRESLMCLRKWLPRRPQGSSVGRCRLGGRIVWREVLRGGGCFSLLPAAPFPKTASVCFLGSERIRRGIKLTQTSWESPASVSLDEVQLLPVNRIFWARVQPVRWGHRSCPRTGDPGV